MQGDYTQLRLILAIFVMRKRGGLFAERAPAVKGGMDKIPSLFVASVFSFARLFSAFE